MSTGSESRVFEFGEFQLDVAERTLTGADGRAQQLTARPMAMLVHMLERPGQLLSKDVLMAAVWRDVVVDESSLSQTIATLRRALGESGREHRHIETVPGAGYRFLGAVTARGDGSASFPAPTPAGPSIAVLPFEDLSAAGDQGYLADGVAEEILDRFAQIAGLRTIGRASSFIFRGRSESPRAVGEELDVDHLLTGAVRREGERLRVSAQLIEAASGAQLWAQTFDRTLGDLFAIQDEIAGAVASAVRLKMTAAASTSAEATSPEVYDIYLHARASYRMAGAEGIAFAAKLYRQAVERDPGFASAWIGLAQASRVALVVAPRHANVARSDLFEAAGRARELAPEFWGTWLTRAWLCTLERDWAGLEAAATRAEELAPAAPPDVTFVRGAYLAIVGRVQEQVACMKATVRDDPFMVMPSGVLQTALHVCGREAEAEAEYVRSLDVPGDRDVAEHARLHRMWDCGDEVEIDAQIRRYLDNQTVPVPVLREAFAVRDRPSEAAALVRAAAERPESQFPTAQMIHAWWLARFGDFDAALAAARRSLLAPSPGVPAWLWHPSFIELRRNRPEFKTLVRELGLVDYWRATGHWGDFARPTGEDDFELL